MNNKLLLSLSFLVLVVVPIAASAHVPSIPFWGEIVSCVGDVNNINFEPCTSLCDLIHTSVHLIYFGISVALYLIFPILFIWGGIVLLTSAGNPGKIESGKKILMGTLIGLLIVLGAWLIIKIFIDILGASGSIPGFGTSFSTCSF